MHSRVFPAGSALDQMIPAVVLSDIHSSEWDSEVGVFAQGEALGGKMESENEVGAVSALVLMGGLCLTRPLARASAATSALAPRVRLCCRGKGWEQLPLPIEQRLLHVLHAQVCVSFSPGCRFSTWTPERGKKE